MSIPLLLAEKIAYLLVFMSLGFIMVKARILKSDDSTALSKIIIYLITPAIVLEAYDVSMTPEIRTGLVIAFIASIAMHFILLGIDFLYKKTLHPDNVSRSAAMYSNTGNILIPIVLSLFGKEWVIYSSAYLSVQLCFVWTHSIGLFSGDSRPKVKKLATNPILISVVIGLVMAFTGIHLPSPVKQITGPLTDMVGPLSLFACGMIATEVKLGKLIRDARFYIVLFIRMIFSPLVILLIAKPILPHITFPDATKIILIPYLAAIAPVGASVVQFAQIYDKDPDFAVAVNIVSTLMCIITMPLFVALFI